MRKIDNKNDKQRNSSSYNRTHSKSNQLLYTPLFYVRNKNAKDKPINSFVQKYLTVAEQKQLIKPKTKLDQTNTNNTPSSAKTTKDNTKLNTKCNYCQKEFSGLQIHLKKNPICRIKHQESTKQQD